MASPFRTGCTAGHCGSPIACKNKHLFSRGIATDIHLYSLMSVEPEEPAFPAHKVTINRRAHDGFLPWPSRLFDTLEWHLACEPAATEGGEHPGNASFA